MTGKILETTFDVTSRVGQLWEDVQNFYVSKGKPLEELRKEVDQGFLADPLGIREFRNIAGKVEAPEVLKFCYAHSDCHPLLQKRGYLFYFGMNNFDPNTWVDDQKNYEIRKEMDDLLKENKQSGRKDISQKIFDWSLQNMNFEGDCPVEQPDWAALLLQCGACTESSSALYFPYSYAGLDPAFYFELDWKPDMRWIERYDAAGRTARERNQDHVLLGIPMEDRSILFVDRINKKVNGDHPFALPLSAMNYSGLILTNLIPLVFENGEKTRGEDLAEMQMELLPSDPFLSFWSILRLESQGSHEKAQKLVEDLSALQHPAKDVLLEIASLALHGWPLFEAMDDRQNPIRKKLEELEKTNPQIASTIYFHVAEFCATFVNNNKKVLVEAIQNGQTEQPEIKKLHQVVGLTVRLFAEALRTNPNAVKAYLGLLAFLDEYGGIVPPLPGYLSEEAGELLKQHPEHGPLHYLRARALGAAFNIASTTEEGNKFLENALPHATRLIELEPDHPLPYIFSAKAHIFLDQGALAWPLLEKAKAISKPPYPKLYYETLFLYAYGNGDAVKMKEVLAQLIEERKWDGLEIVMDSLQKTANGPFIFAKQKEGLETLQNKEPLEKAVRMTAAVKEALGNFPKIQLALEEIQARHAIAAAFIQGKTAWRKIFLKMADGNRAEIHRGFESGLVLIDREWLSKKFQPEEVVDWVSEVMEALAQDLPKDFQMRWISLSVELVNNYIVLDRPSKAAKVLDRMMEMDSTQAITLFAERVLNLKNILRQQKLVALDILYDRREKIAPAVRQAIAKSYEKFLPHVGVEEEKEIRGKITELR